MGHPESQAEGYAAMACMVLGKIGALFATLDGKLGEIAIFDPDAEVQESTIRDGIRFGRALCAYLQTDAQARGITPDDGAWQTIIQATVAHEANRKRDALANGHE